MPEPATRATPPTSPSSPTSPGDYAFLAEILTADRVKAHFGAIVAGAVTRYELPGLGALNFVMQQALGGGVTRSLSLDPHGKSLSSLLLEMAVPDRQGAQYDLDAAAGRAVR
jgi:hypothetical protein